MIRRNFLKGISLLSTGSLLSGVSGTPSVQKPSTADRAYWVSMLTRISHPVLKALSEGKLTEQMPVEAYPGSVEGRKKVTYLEALGRTLCGIAPWLELGPDNTEEGKVRAKYIDMSVRSIKNAVALTSPDRMNFTDGAQPLVDAAFLSHALLRAPTQLWGQLDDVTRSLLIEALLSTRSIKPYQSNWLLFSAMIEAFLFKFSKSNYDPAPLEYALKKHEEWYKGDGVYGDGPEFHFDYYNSFVIHPMMLDCVATINQGTNESSELLKTLEKRSRRYAEIQERLISPEGAFPPVGRSLAYRCGAFQLLAQLALQKKLPDSLPPAQIRSALTAVIKRSMDAKDTFDKEGWLTIGFSGHQPSVGESYISTGSVYLCTAVFLPLGLPATDVFWSGAPLDWTSKKAYSGKDFPIDKALH